MWLPALIGTRIKDMRSKGFRLSAEDIYSVNKASLKDAVVLFNGGCTGELVSGEGLLLTNHHCGYGAIQSHSSVRHDYLTDGFWAMNRSEELPNPGLYVSFLVRMEDVTAQVLDGVRDDLPEARRDSLIRLNAARWPTRRFGGPTAGPMSSRFSMAISISCSYTATTPTSVSWRLRLRRSAS